MDLQATGEAFSPQKGTSITSKNEIFSFFLFLWVKFRPPGSGSGSRDHIESRSGSRSTTLRLTSDHSAGEGKFTDDGDGRLVDCVTFSNSTISFLPKSGHLEKKCYYFITRQIHKSCLSHMVPTRCVWVLNSVPSAFLLGFAVLHIFL
jgi:hypothetical protein